LFASNRNGIPDNKKKQIFEQLKKISYEKGMGIGPSMVKLILNKYLGEIDVVDRIEGDHSKGSIFVIKLPAIN